MQLVLIDSLVEVMKKRKRRCKFFSILLSNEMLLASLEKNEHGTAKMFVTDVVTEDTSSINVDISIGYSHSPSDDDKYKECARVKLTSASLIKDPFKMLMARFHEVVISIELLNPKPNPTPKSSEWLSVDGIKLNQETNSWDGDQGHFSKRYLGNSPCHMRLIASIPDEMAFTFFLSPAEKLLSSESTSNTDIAVAIIAENGAEIYCPLSLLCVNSPVLQAMFSCGLEESKTGKVDMSDVSEEGVRAFLHYLYCDNQEGPWNDAKLVYELLCAAHMYDVQKLEALMLKQLMKWQLKRDSKFPVEIALKVYMFAKQVESAEVLKRRFTFFLKKKMDELERLPIYDELFWDNPNSARKLCKDLVMASTS